MVFKKGSKVEVVVREKDLPCSAWRVGEVVSVTGDCYAVKFNRPKGIKGDTVAAFSAKDFRPIPPQVARKGSYDAGELVEVLDDMCWKTALIMEKRGSWFLISLIGSSYRVSVRKTSIRIRQLWLDGTWFVMSKEFQNNPFVQSSPFGSSYLEQPNDESMAVKSGKRKCSWEEERRKQKGVKTRMEKVDCVALNDDVSSVGSCEWDDNLIHRENLGSAELQSDEAESTCGGDEVNSGYRENHRRDLNTYSCTLAAMYASGPLTWEQEEFLTNLRISLNVSNDEHLIQVRSLISSQSTTSINN